MSDVVWSINIMIAILLGGVAYSIYWIFKYDDWNPNPLPIDTDTSESTHGSFLPYESMDRENKTT